MEQWQPIQKNRIVYTWKSRHWLANLCNAVICAAIKKTCEYYEDAQMVTGASLFDAKYGNCLKTNIYLSKTPTVVNFDITEIRNAYFLSIRVEDLTVCIRKWLKLKETGSDLIYIMFTDNSDCSETCFMYIFLDESYTNCFTVIQASVDRKFFIMDIFENPKRRASKLMHMVECPGMVNLSMSMLPTKDLIRVPLSLCISKWEMPLLNENNTKMELCELSDEDLIECL